MPKVESKPFPTNWHGGGNETECGAGSKVANMQPAIKWLPRILNSINPNLEPVMELGCGDLNFALNAIIPYHAADYWGMDIKERPTWSKQLTCWPKIRLLEENICNPDVGFVAHTVIVRDVFIHLTTKQVQDIISRIKANYLIATTYTGAWNTKRGAAPNAGFMPIDMAAAPFNLKSELLIQEHAPNKFLGVYELERRGT